MNPILIEEKPLTMAEVREQLNVIKERDGELNFRANKTEEALNEIMTIDAKQAQELTKKLNDLDVPRFKNVHIAKIVDTLPASVEELNVILQGYTITVNKENLKKIVEVVSDFIPEKK